MINFVLYPSNFIFLNKTFTTILVTNENFKEVNFHIEKCIKLFNDEIIWSGMFDMDEAKQRVNEGKDFYIGLVENEILGYAWIQNYKDGKKIFNIFVRNNEKNRKYSGSEFISFLIRKYQSNCIVYAEVDEWNVKSINMFKKLGFITY